MHIHPSVVDVIGETPLVELGRFGLCLDGGILAKLEYLNRFWFKILEY
jgi:cysteine synthase